MKIIHIGRIKILVTLSKTAHSRERDVPMNSCKWWMFRTQFPRGITVQIFKIASYSAKLCKNFQRFRLMIPCMTKGKKHQGLEVKGSQEGKVCNEKVDDVPLCRTWGRGPAGCLLPRFRVGWLLGRIRPKVAASRGCRCYRSAWGPGLCYRYIDVRQALRPPSFLRLLHAADHLPSPENKLYGLITASVINGEIVTS